MRWIWIDRFEIFEPGKRAVAIKNVSMAEEHLHSYCAEFPFMPASLMIEGMAQTGGILVGAIRDFSEKVILAKIGRAAFERVVRPGEQLIYDARIESINEIGASIAGVISSRTSNGTGGAGEVDLPVGEVEMMFSHIDKNMAGLEFPEFNFVFNSEVMALFEGYRRQIDVKLPQ
jgi:3-hydroxyacyl-[acyl-carrier-protein] dehydratase